MFMWFEQKWMWISKWCWVWKCYKCFCRRFCKILSTSIHSFLVETVWLEKMITEGWHRTLEYQLSGISTHLYGYNIRPTIIIRPSYFNIHQLYNIYVCFHIYICVCVFQSFPRYVRIQPPLVRYSSSIRIWQSTAAPSAAAASEAPGSAGCSCYVAWNSRGRGGAVEDHYRWLNKWLITIVINGL
jgi:hypothetical protein